MMDIQTIQTYMQERENKNKNKKQNKQKQETIGQNKKQSILAWILPFLATHVPPPI